MSIDASIVVIGRFEDDVQMTCIHILGGGPAGSSAALAALAEGAAVRIIEKSRFPRHKVCGEFFSPEIEEHLYRLGVWEDFLGAGPARVSRLILHFGARSKVARLPETAWGLSRYAFDALLIERARTKGGEVVRESGEPPVIVAAGRRMTSSARGNRLFGFKAHFRGPSSDAVELFFFRGCYVGLSAIEGGLTNVCGLAPESFLSRFAFEFDDVVKQCPALRERLMPVSRTIPWVSTGPLEYGQAFEPKGTQYPAGDALSFVDPFTGSGLLAAVASGALAGRAAARSQSLPDYLAACRLSLGKPFQVASLLRGIVRTGWAERLLPLAPSRLLFALTRPR
jgi:flavin-dependent dehydrogenase